MGELVPARTLLDATSKMRTWSVYMLVFTISCVCYAVLMGNAVYGSADTR